ncbi:MAG: L-aspartate oxidase [Acidimicrobiales bacterium]
MTVFDPAGPDPVTVSVSVGGRSLPVRRRRAVVVGSGVAGMSTALALGACTLITSEPWLGHGGSSRWAQGGVAAAIGPEDTTAAHAADTVAVAGGIADPDIVAAITAGGPAAIDALLALGTPFDRTADGQLARGREAGHSARRIVHASGDATGAAVVAALRRAVEAHPSIEVLTSTTMVDLVRRDDAVVGVILETTDGPGSGAGATPHLVLAPAVILATGGYAHCFARTTTPGEVIGAGIAAAARAGAVLADMEMVQFHPTALDVAAADRLPLLTEALRGEGAVLIDETGRRFMSAVHPDAELAPRDVVARAIYRHAAAGHRPMLDATGAVGDTFGARFPTVDALAREHGFDPAREPLPVTPAAHYCMGGIAVDAQGRTSLPGLWAVGEVTSSGLHGANRLASNSLLEGLVASRAVAVDVGRGEWAAPAPDGQVDRLDLPVDAVTVDRVHAPDPGSDSGSVSDPDPDPASAPDSAPGSVFGDRDGAWAADQGVAGTIRELLWAHAGVERDGPGLAAGRRRLAGIVLSPRASTATRPIHQIAHLVLEAASARTESRGAHFRLDHPQSDPAQAHRRRHRPGPVPTRRVLVTELQPVAGFPLAS